MPRTYGDSFIHIKDLDAVVEVSRPLCELKPARITELHHAIGKNVASLVEEGATLQLGIGAILDAVLLGNYRNLVLAPASVQEMADLTKLAFELADRYNPAVVLTDGFIGQMMEPLELKHEVSMETEKTWAVRGTPVTRNNLISSIFLEPDQLEAHINKLEDKYRKAAECETRYEV
jgi:hypothetical protein